MISEKNMKNKINFQCICSDLDRTLLRKNGTLSADTRKILINLMKQGIEFVPATGRSFYSLPEEIRTLPGVRYAIVSNGAAVYDIKKEKPVFSHMLNSQTVSRVFSLLAGRPYAYEGFIEGVPYTSYDYYTFPEKYGGAPGSEIYIQGTRKPVEDIVTFLIDHKDCLDAFDVIVPPAEKDEVENFLKKSVPDVYITSSVPHLIEISDHRSGKHNGLCEIARILEILPEQIMAFGDGDNDSEMLRTAGMGLAVSNASFACKEAADQIIGHHDEEGMAKFLVQYFNV